MNAFAPGDLLAAGRFRLLAELGGGGMGVVFRARDEQGGGDVAIKILRLASPEAVRRLKREARATEGLDPGRVVRVYEVGETPSGVPFLVMEYVEGRTLRAIVHEGGLERSEAIRILREIATTLGQAHRAGLVHRDVKPDNVIVRGDGRVVLLDFGIAKQLEPSDDAAHITTQLTSEGAMIGTPAYLAPEQALGRDVDAAVDQFALAVTAYELLTGKLPWTAVDVTRMLAQLLAETPPPASTLNLSVPKQFDAVLWRALSKTPDARFATVEEFAEALDAAERGVVTTSSVGTTVEGSSPASHTPLGEASPPAVTPPASPPLSLQAQRSRRIPARAAVVVVLVLAGGGLFMRNWSPVGRSPGAAVPRPGATPVPGVSSQTPLACPIFGVEGLPEIGSRLGAAASCLACVRAKWYLGGSDDRVLVPAALLDAPVQPRLHLGDFFKDGARARSLEAAKARGLPTLDGTVARGGDTWRVGVVLRAADGVEIARSGEVEERYFELAVRNAIARLWQTAPLSPAVIDPEVARWTAYPDIEAGLAELDITQVGAETEACASIHRRGGSLGRAYTYLNSLCPDDRPLLDAGALVVDESSGPALVTSLNAILNTDSVTLSDPEMRRLVPVLEGLRTKEISRFGQSSADRILGMLWSLLRDAEREHAAMLSAVAEDPLLLNAWFHVVESAAATGASETATSLAAVWAPQEPSFLRYAATTKSDALDARLRDDEMAYILEPTLHHILLLGFALAEAGRAEEARALTATIPVDRSAPDPIGATLMLACIDLHDAKFARASSRFESTGVAGLKTLPILASVLGRLEPMATKWATSFVAETEAKAGPLARSSAASVALCMNAGGGLAGRCLSRVEELAGGRNGWGAGGDLFLLGAKRFAAGNVKGAVDAWRPLVVTPSENDDLARLLPTDAFERVGEHDLAARIDARKMPYRQLAGISEATPREARRAFEHGDRGRAKDLAKSVIQAWEVADVTVPAVAEMRVLLEEIGD